MSDASAPTQDSTEAAASQSATKRKPVWVTAVGKVLYSLVVHRARLRLAARHAEDPQTSGRLRRLARRRREDVEELVRTALPDVVAPKPIDHDDVAPHARRELALANEIASIAATLRSNRKVRVNVERATEKNPPARVAAKLARIAADLEMEAGTLNARLRDVAVIAIVTPPQAAS